MCTTVKEKKTEKKEKKKLTSDVLPATVLARLRNTCSDLTAAEKIGSRMRRDDFTSALKVPMEVVKVAT